MLDTVSRQDDKLIQLAKKIRTRDSKAGRIDVHLPSIALMAKNASFACFWTSLSDERGVPDEPMAAYERTLMVACYNQLIGSQTGLKQDERMLEVVQDSIHLSPP